MTTNSEHMHYRSADEIKARSEARHVGTGATIARRAVMILLLGAANFGILFQSRSFPPSSQFAATFLSSAVLMLVTAIALLRRE